MQYLFPPNLSFFALLCGTGAGPVKISPLPVGTILSFVSRDRAIWSGFFSWFWCAFFFLFLWHVPASRVWDSQLCSPLTLVSGFLASLATTPVGSFLLASLSLWPFSEVHLSAIQWPQKHLSNKVWISVLLGSGTLQVENCLYFLVVDPLLLLNNSLY